MSICRTSGAGWLASGVFLAVVLAAVPAAACPACAGNGMPARTVNAYLMMTALLSLAPLVFAAGLVWLLRPPGSRKGRSTEGYFARTEGVLAAVRPKTSGEYIASMRVGGTTKEPTDDSRAR